MSEDYLSVSEVAELFGVRPDTVRAWRSRYEDFPQPALAHHRNYPLYSPEDITNWFIARWPERAAQIKVHVHQFVIAPSGVITTATTVLPSLPEARGYLKAIRAWMFKDWEVWSSSQGFVAEKVGMTHVWVTDVREKPLEWFVYEQRIKAAGRKRE